MLTNFRAFYARNSKLAPAAGFVIGVLFDIVTLGRIDALGNILQQSVYLVLIAVILRLEFLEGAGVIPVPAQLARFWPYRDAAAHFLLGSLLSAYTIFYFKSSSFLNSVVFVSFLVAILVVNEFQHIRRMGVALRSLLFTLCMASFLVFLVPMILGFLGVVPFLLAIGLSAVILLAFSAALARRVPDPALARQQIGNPCLIVLGVFTALYFLQLVPPVPLSLSYIGVFHDVKKEGDRYLLTYSRPAWKIWQSSDLDYAYRPGDSLYGFVRVFSPSRFKDKVQVRWLLHNAKQGWQTQDLIPLEIVGGRDAGYRGYTVKRSFQPGKWRLQVETLDGREVGRHAFRVFLDESSAEREMRTEIQ